MLRLISRSGVSKTEVSMHSLSLRFVAIGKFSAIVALLAASGVQADNFVSPKEIQQFVSRYCFECHSADSHKGDREFESFALPLESEAGIIEAKDIVDQLTLKEMPPQKSLQPGEDERLAVIRSLREGISAARSKYASSGGRTVLRRLSVREYENTLATLFGRRVDTLGLTANFPKEQTSRHLDNIGASLVTSGFLVDQYFQAVNRLVEMRLGKPALEPQTWTFNGHFVQYEELSGPHKSVFNYRYLNLYEQQTRTRGKGATDTSRIS